MKIYGILWALGPILALKRSLDSPLFAVRGLGFSRFEEAAATVSRSFLLVGAAPALRFTVESFNPKPEVGFGVSKP